MPHFKCGTEAKVGDRCRFKTVVYDAAFKGSWVMREGVVISVSPGATACNAGVACVGLADTNGVKLVNVYTTTVTLGECEKAELPLADA